jgi:hypothetical protein
VLAGAAASGRRLAGVYEAVDGAIGHLLDAVGPDTTVVLFSVHDTVANANDLPALYLVPELLHRDAHGWPQLALGAGSGRNRRAELQGGDRGCVSGDDDRDRLVVPSPSEALGPVIERRYRRRRASTAGRPDLLDGARDRLVRIRRRPIGAPPWADLVQSRTMVGQPTRPASSDEVPGASASAAQHGRLPFDYLGTARYEPFWPAQEIFALPTFSDTHLRVNVVGREGAGTVTADRFAALLDVWEERLRALRDARTGRVAVADIVRTRTDPLDPGGPPADLVVRFARPGDLLEDLDQGRLGPLPYLRTGEHGQTGFVRVHRPGGPPRLSRGLRPTDLAGLLTDLLAD